MERKEALEVVRKNMPTDRSLPVYEALQTLIPELAESEDERIRKALVKYFEERNNYRDEDETFNGIPFSDIIAYLERQKKPEDRFEEAREKYQVEWSKEDETRLTNILIMLQEYVIHHYSKDDVNKSVDWLKSLPERFQSLAKARVERGG